MKALVLLQPTKLPVSVKTANTNLAAHKASKAQYGERNWVYYYRKLKKVKDAYYSTVYQAGLKVAVQQIV